MEDTETLTVTLVRTMDKFRKVEGKLETLERECAEIVRKIETAAGDTAALDRLRIEKDRHAETERYDLNRLDGHSSAGRRADGESSACRNGENRNEAERARNDG